MATTDSPTPARSTPNGGFSISEGPIVQQRPGSPGVLSEFGELPQLLGAPLLFAIARDPRTLFTYWNVDWSSAFADAEPAGREVYLRVKKPDGKDETESLVEPMLGSFYAPVAQARGSYRVELGYYDKGGDWRSVANSEAVTMPPDASSENLEVDLATVPFHLSFQRLIDLFRASSGDGLTDVIARLQSRVLTEEERTMLTPEELEILRAMNISVSEMQNARRDFSERKNEPLLRKRTEAILGFGATSPAQPFGESSRG